MYLKQNIKYLRNKTNLTQKQLADRLGLKGYTVVGRYEDGSVSPPINQVQKLSEIFKVTMEDLMFMNMSDPRKHEPKTETLAPERQIRLLNKELDKLENIMENIIKTPGALEAIEKLNTDLAKIIRGEMEG